MKFPKKQAQRLIPEYLLDYTTKLNESHPDPTESWGGGSTVIANPTLSGNEATLDGLEVDGTKYKVGGSGGSTLDDIVDKNGNKRFIEGNGTPGSIDGLTSTYCKWSLSGTHLMCVLSATLGANTKLKGGILATFTVPDYIGRKIIPIWGNHIEIKEPYIKTREGSGPTMSVWVDYYNNNIKFDLLSIVDSANKERYFRIQFDLLIDTD